MLDKYALHSTLVAARWKKLENWDSSSENSSSGGFKVVILSMSLRGTNIDYDIETMWKVDVENEVMNLRDGKDKLVLAY